MSLLANCRAQCPYLPQIDHGSVAPTSQDLKNFRSCPDREPSAHFFACLTKAQFDLIAGLPARALLMLNRAMSLPLHTAPEAFLHQWPIPYAAVAWILKNRRPGEFLGNPRRHWQHLATRMNAGPIRELRIWRAWACWAIARICLPECLGDQTQLEREKIAEPTEAEIFHNLDATGLPDEAEMWRKIVKELRTV